jgi:hypothetical protein
LDRNPGAECANSSRDLFPIGGTTILNRPANPGYFIPKGFFVVLKFGAVFISVIISCPHGFGCVCLKHPNFKPIEFPIRSGSQVQLRKISESIGCGSFRNVLGISC